MKRWPLVLVASLAALGCNRTPTADAPSTEPATQEAAPPSLDDYVELDVGGVLTNGEGHAVILVHEGRQMAVPIFVGETEALSIALRHNRQRYERPLTHDLLDSVMARLGGELVRIQIDEIRDKVFVGAIYVRHEGRVFALDARPSDAIALALGHRVPIYVHEAVLSRAGIKREEADDPPRTI